MYNRVMKAKPLTFLLALTFLFLFSGSVYDQGTEVKKEYWGEEKLKSEISYKDEN
jgi:hypothetical protein